MLNGIRGDFTNLFNATSVPKSRDSGTKIIDRIVKASVQPHVTC